ncbi:MAG: hypothetical protein WAN11_06450 [Syntrophobacteraceae bacterium]
MPTTSQKQALSNAVSCLYSAELLLTQASRDTDDPAKLSKIDVEYRHIDSLMSQLVNLQAIDDDAVFASATGALKLQAAALQKEEDYIKTIIDDVKVAAQIVGYFAQALQIIAAL